MALLAHEIKHCILLFLPPSPLSTPPHLPGQQLLLTTSPSVHHAGGHLLPGGAGGPCGLLRVHLWHLLHLSAGARHDATDGLAGAPCLPDRATGSRRSQGGQPLLSAPQRLIQSALPEVGGSTAPWEIWINCSNWGQGCWRAEGFQSQCFFLSSLISKEGYQHNILSDKGGYNKILFSLWIPNKKLGLRFSP